MTGYAVAVTFRIHAGRIGEFMELMHRQAAASLGEDGCMVFEIWTDSARPGDVFLWEIYTNRAAFDIHLASNHFRQFDQAVRDLVEAKTSLTLDSKAN